MLMVLGERSIQVSACLHHYSTWSGETPLPDTRTLPTWVLSVRQHQKGTLYLLQPTLIVHTHHPPDNMHGGGVVFILVHAHDEHGGVGRGGGDDDLLGSPGDVGGGLLGGGEDPSRLHHIFSSVLAPRDGGWVSAKWCVCVCCVCVCEHVKILLLIQWNP